MVDQDISSKHWYVMRDLKRANAKIRSYMELEDAGFRVFTPMTSKVETRGGKKIKTCVPFIPDLLFVYSDRQTLDREVQRTDTLQYRFLKGAPYGTPMIVPTNEMECFVRAVSSVKTPEYYDISEITPAMCGSKIRMISDGPLNGYEGILLKIKGSGKKRLLVQLPGLLAASVVIDRTDYIELL